MRCTGLFYPDAPSARDAKKRMMRSYHIATNIRHCEACDGYHLPADVPRLLLPKKALDVLKMIAQGYNNPEIAKYLNMKSWTVTWYARVLRIRFNAMSSAHLVAIACALGIIRPNEFVPDIKPIPEEVNNGRHNPDSHGHSRNAG